MAHELTTVAKWAVNTVAASVNKLRDWERKSISDRGKEGSDQPYRKQQVKGLRLLR
jgi:hypothetical protein